MKLGLSRTEVNAIVGALSTVGSSLTAIGCMPLLLRVVGVDAYAVVSFYALLFALATLLDLGLGITINRHVAACGPEDSDQDRLRYLFRRLEQFTWSIGLGLGAILFFLAPLISRFCLQGGVSRDTVEHSLRLMAICLAATWVQTLYANALLGLQRQSLVGLVNLAYAVLRHLGGVAVAWSFSGSLVSYFSWQVAVCVLGLGIFAQRARRAIGPPVLGQAFDLGWRKFAAYAMGASSVSLSALLLTHSDRLTLSATGSARDFTIYSLGMLLAAGLGCISGPLSGALFPRFSLELSRGDLAALQNLYLHGTRVMAALVLPLATLLVVFSREILAALSGDSSLADEGAPLFALLTTGTALNCLSVLPASVLLATGRTRAVVVVNLLATLLFVPLQVLATAWYGGQGAAWIWLALNTYYLLIIPGVVTRGPVPHSWRFWVQGNFSAPVLVGCAIPVLGHLVGPLPAGRAESLLLLALLSVLTLLAALLLCPATRTPLVTCCRNWLSIRRRAQS